MATSTLFTFAAPIMVVEDSDEDFDTFREALAKAGVSRVIQRCVSGGDCLALLHEESSVDPAMLPVFILMDLNSHGIDGREALVTIKTDARLKEIPVVVLTTSSSPKDVAFCYKAGANAYHVKPVRYDLYSSMLGTLLDYWLGSVTPYAFRARVE